MPGVNNPNKSWAKGGPGLAVGQYFELVLFLHHSFKAASLQFSEEDDLGGQKNLEGNEIRLKNERHS